ncbi:MAG: hypothetical protein KF819_09710 [Labilithrix sp.]|nr:hypothetical protein [Labilithrix sp.]
MKVAFASAVVLCLFAGAAPALAQELPPPSDDLERLSATLGELSSQSRNYRTWGGIGTIAVGAAVIPAGAVMLGRSSDDGSPAPGLITVSVGAGAVLGGVLLLAVPTLGPAGSFESLQQELDEGRAAGRPPAEIVAAVEAAWREKAETQRALRQVAGGIGIGVGALAVAGGTIFAVADPIGDLSRAEQDGFAAAFLASGFLAVVLGFQGLMIEESLESSWRAHSAGRKRSSFEIRPTGTGFAAVF